MEIFKKIQEPQEEMNEGVLLDLQRYIFDLDEEANSPIDINDIMEVSLIAGAYKNYNELPEQIKAILEFNRDTFGNYLKFNLNSILFLSTLCRYYEEVLLTLAYIIKVSKEKKIKLISAEVIADALDGKRYSEEQIESLSEDEVEQIALKRNWEFLLGISLKEGKVIVGFPNLDEEEIPLETAKSWEIREAKKIGDTIFFYVGSTYVRMNQREFEKLEKDIEVKTQI